jgi:hypothetical protein
MWYIFEKKNTTMNKSYVILLLCGLSILFAGCPYGADVPIDKEPTIPIDKTLLGKWENSSASDYTYYFRADDANTYRISKISSSTGDSTVYFAFESKIDNVSFINIYEANEFGSKTYYLYKLTKRGTSKYRWKKLPTILMKNSIPAKN